jgi:predicted nucleic acid-binding protein
MLGSECLGGGSVVRSKGQDTEDAHILETAIAGKADFIVTANFKDFIVRRDTKIEIPDRHGIFSSAAHSLQIVHPSLIFTWLKQGTVPPLPK